MNSGFRISLKHHNGNLHIKPEGSRVVPIPGHQASCRCNGKCKVCKCAEKKTPGIIGITTFPPPTLCRSTDNRRTADGDS